MGALMASAGVWGRFCRFVWKEEAAARRGKGAARTSQSFDTWWFSFCEPWGQPPLRRPVLVPVTVLSVGPGSEQGNRLFSTAHVLTCRRQLSES